MGNTYTIFPTGELDDESRNWFRDELGVSLPSLAGRFPTTRELRATLDSLDGCDVRYRTAGDGGLDADIRHEGRSTTIWAKPGATEDEPCDFTFHKPDELPALHILERLARICGPLLIIEASGMTAVVVTSGDEPASLLERWHAQQGTTSTTFPR